VLVAIVAIDISPMALGWLLGSFFLAKMPEYRTKPFVSQRLMLTIELALIPPLPFPTSVAVQAWEQFSPQ
jgi:hypothetical protein